MFAASSHESIPPNYHLPASQFNGLSAAGADNKAITARQAACKLQAGDHSFFKISKQISPVCLCVTHERKRGHIVR